MSINADALRAVYYAFHGKAREYRSIWVILLVYLWAICVLNSEHALTACEDR